MKPSVDSQFLENAPIVEDVRSKETRMQAMARHFEALHTPQNEAMTDFHDNRFTMGVLSLEQDAIPAKLRRDLQTRLQLGKN